MDDIRPKRLWGMIELGGATGEDTRASILDCAPSEGDSSRSSSDDSLASGVALGRAYAE